MLEILVPCLALLLLFSFNFLIKEKGGRQMGRDHNLPPVLLLNHASSLF